MANTIHKIKENETNHTLSRRRATNFWWSYMCIRISIVTCEKLIIFSFLLAQDLKLTPEHSKVGTNVGASFLGVGGNGGYDTEFITNTSGTFWNGNVFGGLGPFQAKFGTGAGIKVPQLPQVLLPNNTVKPNLPNFNWLALLPYLRPPTGPKPSIPFPSRPYPPIPGKKKLYLILFQCNTHNYKKE